jgi:hypothetical protein
MTTLQGAAPVRPVEAQLADLICADPDLLHAEFEAIISAGWDSDVPTGRPRRPPAPRPAPHGPPPTACCPHPHPSRPPVDRRLQRRAGQRAPPSTPTLDTSPGEGRHRHFSRPQGMPLSASSRAQVWPRPP